MLFYSARILRGIRIAARLGLSFSKDIESAIHKHSSSILNLGAVSNEIIISSTDMCDCGKKVSLFIQFRIMMEMNYMLSFGAAESSLRLLHRFHVLEILLPFQVIYK